MNIRKAISEDNELIMMRNDPLTKLMSINSNTISFKITQNGLGLMIHLKKFI